MSVSDDLPGLDEQEFNDALELHFNALTETDRLALVERVETQNAFCRKFSTLAPKAWTTLLSVVDHANRIEELFNRTQDPSFLTKRETLIDESAASWCEEFQLESLLMFTAAGGTIRNLASADRYSFPRQSTLTTFTVPFMEPDGDGMIAVGLKTFKLDYESLHEVTIDAASHFWRPSQESKAQFRTRLVRNFTNSLNAQLNAISAAPTQRPPTSEEDTMDRWIEWLILRRAGKQSERAVSTRYGLKSRNSVRKGEKRVAEILQLPAIDPTAYE